ncbi:MAG: glycogen synthase GlgA [Deltaproteobacteria bacterium]
MAARPSVLFVASECAPFAKAGGLGDVVGALPAALAAQGHDVRIVIPRYNTISTEGMRRHETALGVPLGGGEAWAGVYETRLPGSDVPVYMLDHLSLFGRGYLYDPPNGYASDNLARFAFLSRGALQLCKMLGWYPDVFHVHDWPASLVPVYLNTVERHGPLGRAATVLTIHNLAHQGRFPKADLPATHVPWSEFNSKSLEDQDTVNVLKGGLYHATMLTAVSPRYAEEIRHPEHGAGLDPVLRFRGADLVGILNGIDDHVWNPATDPHLPANYSAYDLSGKGVCKLALQGEMHLAPRADVPLIGVVSRLTDQKGTDVIAEALPGILGLGAQMVVLGSGDRRTEEYLAGWSHHGGDRFRAWVGFNEALSHRIEAGADMFLMPSRFEPCGLNQMYSQRYGTPPIVRATGGLDDTVENYDLQAGTGTGFKMWDLHPAALIETVGWAREAWRTRPDAFRAMQQRAMRKDFAWRTAAQKYGDLYDWALERRRWNE